MVKRAGYFLLLLLAVLAVLLPTVVWYLAGYQSGTATVGGMMGQMMGNQFAYGTMTPMPTYVWALVSLLLILLTTGIVGTVYYLALPEIPTASVAREPAGNAESTTANPKEDWAVLLRTSKPDEKKVLEVVVAHDGKYLQKFIVKESGLSRLKTHRIVSRLAERGIVVVSKSGNTNEVCLAPWLKPNAKQTRASDA